MTASVFSQQSLTADLTAHLESAPAPERASATTIHKTPRRKAIFAIHGISPIQRYAFQDQVALALQCYLNAREALAKSNVQWNAVVHWPKSEKDASPSIPVRPSALRVYRSDDDPADPAHTVYDVYEGYWSPLSKGKTNILSAAKWLLNATFFGTSSTANIPCTPQKLWSDLGYVGLLLFFAAFIALLSVAAAIVGWMWFVKAIVPNQADVSLYNLLAHPFASALKLPVKGYTELALTTIAAYLLAQLIAVHNVSKQRRQRTSELQQDAKGQQSTFRDNVIKASAFHRSTSTILWIGFVITALLAIALPLWLQHLKWTYPVGAAIVTAAVLGFQWARSGSDFAVENIFGDVQVYTTHDNNSDYYAIRQKIVQTVSEALVGVLVAKDPQQADSLFYDSIHIFGHSLGSTVGMDVLILLRQMVEEGTLQQPHWQRIRTFTTFGTALEKTRFFFDVRQPTISAAQSQWANDVYGRFFTDGKAVLAQPDNANGIYWNNLWYFKDIVANEIVSYQSEVAAGSPFIYAGASRTICDNYQLDHAKTVPWAWVHSDYLGDKNFWANVGPVVA